MKGMKCVYMAGAMMLLLAGAVNASVITNYYDSFSGLVTAGLNGTTPDVSLSGGTWTGANTRWKADGSVTGGGTLQRGAYLAFAPESGKIYEYSVDVDMTTHPNSADYMSMGFSTLVSGNPHASDVANIAIRGGGIIRYEIDGGTLDGGSDTVVNISTNVAPYTFKVVLDTTDTAWTVHYYVDDVSVGDGEFSSNPSVAGIFINQYGAAAGSVDNLSLTTIPEPATVGLFMLSACGLLMLRRLL